MSNVVIKMADPEMYDLINDFCDKEDIPQLSPEWSKVVVAIDLDTEEVVGIVVAQMQVHTEPIWVHKDYQGDGLWKELVDRMEGYLDTLAFSSGLPIAVWNQPTNAAAERICRLRGYTKNDKPLYTKIYSGETILKMLSTEDLWQPQSQLESDSEAAS